MSLVSDEQLAGAIEAFDAAITRAGIPPGDLIDADHIALRAMRELQERRVEVEKYKAWAASCDPAPPTPLTSKPINLSQEWVTKVTSQHGESPSVIGPPGIPDFERWVLQLNWYHSPDCTVKQPSAQCSCGLHALKSQIRQAHTDLEAEAERLTRCLAACDNGDCECPQQVETSGVHVAGNRLSTSLAMFQHKCSVRIGHEQVKANPDNALIDTLCEAIRLCRENEELARSSVKSNEQPSAPASPPLSKSASSTDEAGAGLTISKPAQHIPGALRCEKHGVTFAFDGDTCWACQEESNAPINS